MRIAPARLRSLRSLTLGFVAAVLLVTIGTGVAIYVATHHAIAALVDARIVAVADSVVAETEAGPRPTLSTAELLRRLAALDRDRATGDLGTVLFDRVGRRIGGNVAPRRVLPTGLSSVRVNDGIAGLTAGRAFVRDAGDGQRLAVIAETEPFDDYPTARVRIYLIGFGAILLVVMAGMLLFARLVGRRIGAMRATVDAIVDGDMRQRIPLEGDGGTFDRQAAAFNGMLDRIAALMAGISNVSNDIAHDLRSPLARLRAHLARLERQAAGTALHDGVSGAIDQTDAVLAMFAAMLRIAEVEGGNRRAGFVDLDLGALVGEIAAMMAPVAEDGGRSLTLADPAALPIRGDKQLLVQVVMNLIENALRHTPAGTDIRIAADAHSGAARVTIADNGPGIAADDRTQAMTRFGRLDESRTGAGHGLGLPLVEAIMRLHRGGIVLEDAAPAGLRVVLTLPLRMDIPVRT